MLRRTGRWLFLPLSPFRFSLHAQETRSTVLGRISDPTGAVIPGAVVEATNLDTGVRAMVPTNASGDFLLPFLIPGPYSLDRGSSRASRSGFVPGSRRASTTGSRSM